MKNHFNDFFDALGFLTRIPVPKRASQNIYEIGRSMAHFPIVGLIVGLLLALGDLLIMELTGRRLGSGLSSVSVLVLNLLITGGIHIEGFADTADGFFSGKKNGDLAKVMKDPRIGAHGASSLTLLLLFKFVILSSLSEPARFASIMVVPVISRWCMVFAAMMGASPQWAEEGLGHYFLRSVGRRELGIATLEAFLITVFVFNLTLVAILFAVALVVVFFVVLFFMMRFGGMTGDTFGATNEILEVSLFLFLVFAGTRA